MTEGGVGRGRELFVNRAFWLFVACWLASVAVLAAHGQSVAEPLIMAAIFGVALPLAALGACRGLPPKPPDRSVAGEGRLLAGLLLLVVLFVAFKGQIYELILPAAADPRAKESFDIVAKLLVFVAVPIMVYRWRAKLSPRALGLDWPPAGPLGRIVIAGVVVGVAMVAIQLVVGRNARALFDGTLAGHNVSAAFLFALVWLSIEAGLVEETFFRILLQSRLAAIARSQTSGLFLSALVFGLAHAPGLWLRGAGAMEGMTEAPSLLVAAAYCLTVMGMAGLVFGVLWLRTRNWLLIVVLHGLTDALSNTARLVDVWGF